MNTIQPNHEEEIGSEKSFGIVFSIFFLIISIYTYSINNEIFIWFAIISLIFIALSFFLPNALILPNRLWAKFGIMLGLIISPIVLGLIFILTILPIGIIFKIFGKDPMLRNFSNEKSYWISKDKSIKSSMKNQF